MTSSKDLTELARSAGHKQVRVRVSVASHPGATPQLLARLASDSSRSVRRVVASRPDAPPDSLRQLVKDPDRQTREALAGNPGCPQDALAALLLDPRQSVRWAVIDNPAADLTVRRAICESPDADLRHILAQRADLQDEILALLQGDASAQVRAALAENTQTLTVLAVLVDDPAPTVRTHATMNPHITAEQLHRLVGDSSWQVRAAVVVAQDAHGRRMPEEDLLTLAHDRSVNVRWWLATLPGATRRVYEILTRDTDDMVADAARSWLLPPDSPHHPDNHQSATTRDLARLTGFHPVRPSQSPGPEHPDRLIAHLPPSHPPASQPAPD